MNKNIAPLALALATAALGLTAAPAAAENAQQITVAFNYDETRTVAQNYKTFKNEARRACRGSKTISALSPSRQASRACRAELLDAAVKASGNRDMIALHLGNDAPVLTAQVVTR